MPESFGPAPFEAMLDELDARRRPAKQTRPKVAPATLARIRLAVYRRCSFACQSCGWTLEVPDGYDGRLALGEDYMDERGRIRTRILELDHITPYLHGGEFTEDNLQALCNSCNARKGATL